MFKMDRVSQRPGHIESSSTMQLNATRSTLHTTLIKPLRDDISDGNSQIVGTQSGKPVTKPRTIGLFGKTKDGEPKTDLQPECDCYIVEDINTNSVSQPKCETGEPLGIRSPKIGSPTVTRRRGYLLKQGGHNCNKGWKRRWAVFNGISLRYYKDEKSPQSIRIIPLKGMIKVEVDIKPTDRDSFKFTLHTNIKNRVFLFASETRDNCLQWALTLGAAITQCQKFGWFQDGHGKTDKEGFVRINCKKYYSTVMDQKLTYYNTFEDFELGSPIDEVELNFASIKIVDEKRFKVKLSTHRQTFLDLTFQDQDDMQQWTSALAEALGTAGRS